MWRDTCGVLGTPLLAIKCPVFETLRVTGDAPRGVSAQELKQNHFFPQFITPFPPTKSAGASSFPSDPE
jgi:hypothetical protein